MTRSPAEHLYLQQLMERIEDPEVATDRQVRPLDPDEVFGLWQRFSREGWCECRVVTEESVGRFAGWLVRHLVAGGR